MIETIISLLLSQNLFLSSPQINNENHITAAQNIAQNINLLPTQPVLSAESALIFDVNTNTVLFSKNSQKQLSIASLTKLMTAYIILSENNLNETVTVTSQSTSVEPSKVWLSLNDQLTIQSLLSALLIESANDAAYALAIHNAGSPEAFTQKMNNYAQLIGLKNTSYSNPAGFDNPNNFSSGYDLLVLSKLLLNDPLITQISSQQSAKITNLTGNKIFPLQNTNLLLNTAYQIVGLKTGTTPIAGQCLITITNGPNPQIAIVIGSYNRFHDTKVLLDWAQELSATN